MRSTQVKNVVCVVLFALWGVTGISAQASAETVVVYGDENHAPLGYLEDGAPKGVLVNMFAKISKITGDTYDIQLRPWARAQAQAKAGKGGLMNLSMNDERLAFLDFSEPMYFDDVLIVVLKAHAFPFNKLSDLDGKALGGNIGGSYGEAIDEAIKSGKFRIEHDISPTGRLKKLLAGRMDAALIPGGVDGFEAALAKDDGLMAQRERFEILEKPFVHDPLYFAMPKSLHKKDLIERFNKALKKLNR